MKRYLLSFLVLPFLLEGISERSPYYNYTDPDVCSNAIPELRSDYCCKDSISLYFSADYLYWIASEDGLKFAYSNAIEFPRQNADCKCGKIFEPEFEWSSGFKVGAGMILPFCGWGVSINYTNLTTEAKDSVKAGDNYLLHKYWKIKTILPQILLRADGKWNLKFNVIDVEIGNEYNINYSYTLRPYFGIKGSWQDQNYRVDYLGINPPSYTLEQQQCFSGIGPRAGLLTKVHLNSCLNIFGNFSLSGLWGDFNINRKDKARLLINPPVIPPGPPLPPIVAPRITVLCLDHHTRQVVPVFEYSIGAEWDFGPFKCFPAFGIKAAWEQQVWLKQNQFIYISEDNNDSHGHLNLQGVTVTGLIEF